ncbi:unnamed protein product [Rotaria magnacalcarata]|uniref:VWFA domain-containing protein n=1 Tax=Rotaria magnacalcarata TaxID=392030 RepID=A0A816ZNE2_9BILA|nr:unnamed protein product [Rotaria magnacalcarata]CAF4055609.1 unnamed protein product [Rotaria magnacalcarata]
MYYLSVICFVLCAVYSTIVASSFPVQLSIGQEKRFFPHEISTYTQHVNIQIKTGPPSGTQTKLPCELFIVLDSSGSMAGKDKWNNAISAIEHIVQNMNSGDKLHLVQYNSFSSIIFENGDDQQAMLKALHKLQPYGGTNLMAGLDQVIPLLKKYSDRFTVKRLFILSDGQINEGVTDHGMLLKEVTRIKNMYDVTICSFGIGYDFDEKLLTDIADYGSGDYFFIKGAESMEKVVGIAYRGFQNLMGTNAYLKVITKYDVQIIDVYGYDMKQDEEQIIPIGNLRYNDMMNVLLETKVKITKELLENRDIDYMVVSLWMTDINDRLPKLVVTETVLFSLSRNDDELKEFNEIVQSLVKLQKIQRREREVTELLKQQQVSEASDLLVSLAADTNEVYANLPQGIVLNKDDLETLTYTQRKIQTMSSRTDKILTSVTSKSLNSAELAMESAYYQKLNEKHSEANEDL